jgi:hypothetical protein
VARRSVLIYDRNVVTSAQDVVVLEGGIVMRAVYTNAPFVIDLPRRALFEKLGRERSSVGVGRFVEDEIHPNILRIMEAWSEFDCALGETSSPAWMPTTRGNAILRHQRKPPATTALASVGIA